DDDHQDRRRHRDQHGVPERRREARGQEVRVVLEGELGGLGEHGPPAGRGVVLLGAQRHDEQAERRHQPEDRDEDHEHLDQPAADPVHDPPGEAAPDPGGGSGRGRHRSSLLNRRMLKIMNGMTSTRRKTASALPRPWLPPPPNDTRHISSAITFACGWTDPGAMMNTRSKTFRTLMIIVTKT